MNQIPEISIVIPVYNAERFLSECILSVLSQSFALFELILVDDGSSDGSPLICETYGENDFRVRVIHKVHRGVSAARNEGIREAEGRYIVFVDADDLLPHDALEKLYSLIKDTNLDIVFGQSVMDYSGRRISKVQRLESGVYSYRDLKSFLIDDGTLCGFLFSSVWGAIYRRSSILDNGILFDENVELNEDGLFNFRLVSRCNKIAVTEDIVYIYRKWKTEKSDELTKNDRFDACQRVLKEYVREMDDDFEIQMQRREITIMYWNALQIEVSSSSMRQATAFLHCLISDKRVSGNFGKLDYSRMNRYRKVLIRLLEHRMFTQCFLLLRYAAPVLRRRAKR